MMRFLLEQIAHRLRCTKDVDFYVMLWCLAPALVCDLYTDIADIYQSFEMCKKIILAHYLL